MIPEAFLIWSLGFQPMLLVERQHSIIATTFSFQEDGKRGAYGDFLPPDHLYVALPAEMPPGTLVRVWGPNGSLIAQVLDKGPWNAARKRAGSRDDPYWLIRQRPQAESGRDHTGRRTNGAGIDLSPGIARRLGIQGRGKVDWELIIIAPPFVA